MAREELVLDIQAKLDKAKRDVAKFQKQLDQLAETATVEVRADVEGAQEVVDLDATLRAVDGDTATATVQAEVQGQQAVDDLTAKLEAASAERHTAQVTADVDRGDLDDLEGDLDALTSDDAEIPVTADTSDAEGDLERTEGKVDALNSGADIPVDADTTTANSDLDTTEGKAAALTTKRTIPVDVDPAGAKAGLQSLDDQSRSVGANLAGNVASELPGIAGAFGPLNMALGQAVEYATEGNIQFKNLIKQVGPIAAAAATFLAIRNAVNYFQRDTKTAAQRVEDLAEAIESAGDVTQGVRDYFEQFGVTLSDNDDFLHEMGEGLFGLGDDVENLNGVLLSSGITFADWAAGIEDYGGAAGRAIFEAIQDAHDAGIITEEEMKNVGEAFTMAAGDAKDAGVEIAQAQLLMAENATTANEKLQELLDQDDPMRKFADQWQILQEDIADGTLDTEQAAAAVNLLVAELGVDPGDVLQTALDANAEAEEELEQATEDAADALDDQIEGLQEQADALRESAEALAEQADAQMAANDVYYAQRDAYREAADASAAYQEVVADEESTLVERTRALENVAKAADEAAMADVEVARQTKEAAGESLTHTEALDIQTQSLLRQAGTLQGEERQAILDHIGRLHSIPPELLSEVLTLIERGQYDAAMQLLNDLSVTRDTTYKADMDEQAAAQVEGEANELARDRDMTVVAEPDFSQVYDALRALRNAQIIARIAAGFQSAPAPPPATATPLALAAAPAPAALGPATMTAPRPVVHNHVTLQAGVIGNRYDVQRLVLSAMRNAARLGGAA